MKNFKIKITNLNHDNVFYKEDEVYSFDETNHIIKALIKSGNLEEVQEEVQGQVQEPKQLELEPEHELLEPEPEHELLEPEHELLEPELEPEHELLEPEHELKNKSFKKGKK